VAHLEGASSGRDLAVGVKRHQVTNRATFRTRWERALADQPPHPPVFDRATWHRLQARRADARRALVVLPTMPEPDREGGSRRAFHIIDLLLAAGWTVSVVVENATGGERYARALRQRGASVYAGEFTRGVGPGHLPRLADLVTVEEFDVALIAFWHVAERHLPTLRRLTPRTRVLVDSVDLHFLRQARGAFGRARLEGRADALDGQFADEVRRELNVYGCADAVLTVSRKEASWVDDLVGVRGHGHCVPLMEDALGPETTLEQRRGLVFLGNFRHPPNVEALAFLAEVVARLDPAVLAAHPLSIVGNALVTGMLGPLAGHPHVRAVGWVPAVEPYLGNARLSLVPLRHGAGTKAKLLQSMVAGTPCVSTSVGVEGFDVADGRDVMVADTAEAFAAAIAALSRDDDAWRRLSRDGRAAVQEAHGRRAVGASLQAALRALL
jgi:glycosyltransferase involved in cell wall biosynthesis